MQLRLHFLHLAAKAIALVETQLEGVAGSKFGAGIDENIVNASIQAIFSALNRYPVLTTTSTATA